MTQKRTKQNYVGNLDRPGSQDASFKGLKGIPCNPPSYISLFDSLNLDHELALNFCLLKLNMPSIIFLDNARRTGLTAAGWPHELSQLLGSMVTEDLECYANSNFGLGTIRHAPCTIVQECPVCPSVINATYALIVNFF